MVSTLETPTLPAAPAFLPAKPAHQRCRTASWMRRLGLALVVTVLTFTAGSMVTGGAGPAAANPACTAVGAIIPGSGDACEKGLDLAGGILKDKAGDAASSVVGGSFEKIVNSLLESYQKVLGWALTWWIELPTPELDNSNSLMQDIHDHMVQIQVVGLAFSLMFFGFRMMMDRKRSLADDAEDGFKILLRAALSVSVIPLFITVGGQISDAFSNWLVGEAIGAGQDGDIIKNFLRLDVLTNSSFGTTALGVLGLFGFLGALLQLAFLILRQAMLLLVVGALPVAASFSGTGPGSQTYQRLISWSVAFLLFKPVGAMVYFIAFKGAAQKDNDQQVVLGMVLMAMCALVLPSLMRLVAPAIGSMGAGASGAAAGGAALGAAVAVGGAMATGGASAAGGAASTSSIATRSGQQSQGQITSSSTNSSSGGDSPASSPPSVGPGAQPALSGGNEGSSSSGDTGNQVGPQKALTGAGVGSTAGGAVGATGSAIGNEADVAGPPVSMQPRMQSGWGENAMDH